MLKIGLVSDVHATLAPLQEALTVFKREGVDSILCAGDIAGYGTELEQTIDLLIDNNCQAVMGNHDLWRLDRSEYEVTETVEEYLLTLPAFVELIVGGKLLHMVHASPPESMMDGIKLLDEDAALLPRRTKFWSDYLSRFPFDVLVVGHTHQVFAEMLGATLVVNPGSTKFNHTCAILSVPELKVQVFPLSGKTPIISWNWGLAYSLEHM